MNASRLCMAAALPVLLCAQSSGPPFAATPQRPTFTSDTSTTAPGTLELQLGGTFSSGFFSLPTTLKFTPGAGGGFFHQGEFSASVNAVKAISRNGRTVTRFGDWIELAWRRPVYAQGGLSFAVAPQVTVSLREGGQSRAGFTGIMAYSQGRNGVAVNANFNTGADTPAGWIAADFARFLAASGPWSKVAVFAGLMTEHARHDPSRLSLGQGLLWRVRPNLVLDAALRQVDVTRRGRDWQALTGLTLNLGRLAR